MLGRQIELVIEDDQTNPEAAVRAARKLIDVDQVPVIMGTWASAVTTAVAPLCWESKTFLTTVSGADTITQLPHQGYLIRTQPNTNLQVGKHRASSSSRSRSKRVFMLVDPGAVRAADAEAPDRALAQGRRRDRRRADLRQGQDHAIAPRSTRRCATKPDMIYLNGYAPDVHRADEDLYRAGYTSGKVAQAYAVTSKVLDSLPPR